MWLQLHSDWDDCYKHFCSCFPHTFILTRPCPWRKIWNRQTEGSDETGMASAWAVFRCCQRHWWGLSRILHRRYLFPRCRCSPPLPILSPPSRRRRHPGSQWRNLQPFCRRSTTAPAPAALPPMIPSFPPSMMDLSTSAFLRSIPSRNALTLPMPSTLTLPPMTPRSRSCIRCCQLLRPPSLCLTVQQPTIPPLFLFLLLLLRQDRHRLRHSRTSSLSPSLPLPFAPSPKLMPLSSSVVVIFGPGSLSSSFSLPLWPSFPERNIFRRSIFGRVVVIAVTRDASAYSVVAMPLFWHISVPSPPLCHGSGSSISISSGGGQRSYFQTSTALPSSRAVTIIIIVFVVPVMGGYVECSKKTCVS